MTEEYLRELEYDECFDEDTKYHHLFGELNEDEFIEQARGEFTKQFMIYKYGEDSYYEV